ncbi:MAG TPA: response regulator transcription factor [Longimicrobiaceae bacterium]
MVEGIRVLLVDDHAIFRNALAALLRLEPDLDVVGKVGSGEEAIERACALRPDVVLMDLRMPGMDGYEATRRIVALGTGSRVLALTSHAEEECLLAVLKAGAHGFVHKARADQELISAIHAVSRDEVFLYPGAARLLLQGFRDAATRREASPLRELSEREVEVLTLTARGYSSAEVGRTLFLSAKTVDTYRSRMMHKLGLARRADLVRFALESGVLAAPMALPRA